MNRSTLLRSFSRKPTDQKINEFVAGFVDGATHQGLSTSLIVFLLNQELNQRWGATIISKE